MKISAASWLFLLFFACGAKRDDSVQVRFVMNNETWRSNLDAKPNQKVIAANYGNLQRATDRNPWDLYDPITGKYIAAFSADGISIGLWAVAGPSDTPIKVTFESVPPDLFEKPPAWGVLSVDGRLLYLSSVGGALVAERKGKELAFGPLSPVGFGVQIVHDISPDGRFAIGSGHKPYKWETPTDVVAPRQMSMFQVAPTGVFNADVSAAHPPLKDFMQSPVFTPDSKGLIYEGDDDTDTGDHLFLYRFGKPVQELKPEKQTDEDFNTPCVTRDERVLFWESKSRQYLLRVFDLKKKTTRSVHPAWLPFTGYVRCR